MVRVLAVVQTNTVLKKHERIAREKVRYVPGQNLVDAAGSQPLHMLFATRQRHIIVYLCWQLLTHRAVAQVAIDGVEARLSQQALATAS
jgi:hypothetical protein